MIAPSLGRAPTGATCETLIALHSRIRWTRFGRRARACGRGCVVCGHMPARDARVYLANGRVALCVRAHMRAGACGTMQSICRARRSCARGWNGAQLYDRMGGRWTRACMVPPCTSHIALPRRTTHMHWHSHYHGGCGPFCWPPVAASACARRRAPRALKFEILLLFRRNCAGPGCISTFRNSSSQSTVILGPFKFNFQKASTNGFPHTQIVSCNRNVVRPSPGTSTRARSLHRS